MSKRTKYAEIPYIETGIVLHEPDHELPTWRHNCEKFQAMNWLMKYEVKRNSRDVCFITLAIGCPTFLTSLIYRTHNGYCAECELSVPMQYTYTTEEFNIDTHRGFFGSLRCFEQAEDRTQLSPGIEMPGLLYIFTLRGNTHPAGYLLFAATDNITPEFELLWFQNCCADFNAVEIKKREYDSQTDPSDPILRHNRICEILGAVAYARYGIWANFDINCSLAKPMAKMKRTSVTVKRVDEVKPSPE